MSERELEVGQKVPNQSETMTVGAIISRIHRNSPDFNLLVKNTNTNIVFKDEEKTGADRLMTRKLSDRLDELASLVIQELDGTKLRVTEAWDEEIEHSRFSTHYEGRAADITTSELDRSKYGRLAQLEVDAGLEWVFFENKFHVHVSVSK